MSIYILIILAGSGHSVAMAEFANQGSCQEAAAQVSKAVVTSNGYQYYKAICTRRQ